jgi:nitric oxide reductase NorQ protein
MKEEDYILLSQILHLKKLNCYRKRASEMDKKIEILPIRAEDFILKDEVFYVETDDELSVIEVHLETQHPLCFQGLKGIGKTLAFAYYAQKNEIPIIQFDCSEGTKYSQLYGCFVLIGEKVFFKPGALAIAYTIANQVGKCILILEEINALSPAAQKLISSSTDYRHQIYIEEINKVFKCIDENKLLIGATMNPSFYGGVSELNEDLKSRFSILDFGYPDANKESEIIRCEDKQLERMLFQIAMETRKGEETLNYSLSPRDLVACVEIYNAYLKKFDKDRALKMMLQVCIMGKFEGKAAKETLRLRIDSIFGVELEIKE